ncbi:unnamed protein product [Cuscuta campestris]|uniref:PI-PLC Y-box domain-containing protein n=1 Tax=Cuscuta campestris TaxID=132261 RepID=A0A484N249_9ASTE|nr:unnamed protein product [Cuscuta campestris]
MASLSFHSGKIRHPSLHSFNFPSHSFPSSLKTSPLKTNFKNLHFLSSPASQTSISSPMESADEEDDPTADLSYLDPEINPGTITQWEMDFCSRPILDIRGKKLWELVVCDPSLSLQYTKYFPNNVINSVTLKESILSICDDLGVPLPDKIRFFRSQMQTIISRACNELDLRPVPSKRCFALILWLEERFKRVYTRHPGYKEGSKPLFSIDNPFPMQLPENLYGEKWAFVQLPFSAVKEKASSLQARPYMFGASLDLDLLGIEISDETLVPGLAVASSRATPLAAWMNGLEMCSIEVDIGRGCLVLAVGISTRYVYATYKKTRKARDEGEAWEASKKACGGLHFLAIQDELDSDGCVGFWLLFDLPPPPV